MIRYRHKSESEWIRLSNIIRVITRRDFENYEFKIDDIPYTTYSMKFQDHLNKFAMWEKLKRK